MESLAPLHKKFSPRILNIFTEHVGCKNKRSLKKCSLAALVANKIEYRLMK